jgi:hypothetical protein
MVCEDLASSIMRAEYYQCALACCDRKLECVLRDRKLPRPPRKINKASSGRRSVLRLPNEILMEIFLRSLAEFPSHKPASPPLSLSQVCSLWRGLALGMPDLWNKMTLDTALRGYPGYDVSTNPVHPVDPYSRLQMAMDTWACRAIQQPLHWRLIIDGTIRPMPESFKEAFFSHLPSLQSLDAYFALITDFDALVRTPYIFQNLSSLKLSCMENEEDPFIHLDLTNRAPRLTSLTLAFRFCTSLHGVYDLHFPNVTHLDLLRTAMACNLVFDILKRCKNLQEGAFHTYSSEIPNDESNDYLIVQDQLRILTILANSEHMSFFPKIEYPSLRRLHYAPSDNPTWSVGTPVPNLYQFRHIHHLTFADFEIDGDQFLAATLFFTRVETLVLRFRCASEFGLLQRFFYALRDTTQETNYLPELKSLIMQRCKSFPVSEFVSMISRRGCLLSGDVHSVSMLKSVALHFKHHCNASESLVRLVESQKIRGISFILEVDSEKYCRPVSETGVL